MDGKYPLDSQGLKDLVSEVVRHDDAQISVIKSLRGYLREAMSYVPEDNGIKDKWYKEAEELLKSLHKRGMDFENFRFDQSNGHNVGLRAPTPTQGPGRRIGIEEETKLNIAEEGFGDLMTEAELAEYFGEAPPKKKPVEKEVSSMETLEEIKEWEAKQVNSNDIYKISARIKNLARGSDGAASLTPVGEMMCNIYTHMLKDLYTFADGLKDKEVKMKLTDLIRSKEGLPGDVIMASKTGVKE